MRWKSGQLQQVVAANRSHRLRLTLGVHSRIETTIVEVTRQLLTRNIYVNRNMMRAVVGVQPFGRPRPVPARPRRPAGRITYALRHRADRDDQHRRSRRQRQLDRDGGIGALCLCFTGKGSSWTASASTIASSTSRLERSNAFYREVLGADVVQNGVGVRLSHRRVCS